MQAFEILLPLALILGLTKLMGLGSKKLGLPAVIGMLVAGLLIGLLKFIPWQPLQYMLFSENVKQWLDVFSKIGVVLIMFSTGLETDLKLLKQSGKASILITSFGVVVPLGLGTLLAFLFKQGDNILGYLFYGAILTATSVSVVVATLKELGKLNTRVGASIVCSAVLDDILGIVLLSVLSGFAPNHGAVHQSDFLPEFWTDAPWWLVIIKIVVFFAFAVGLGLLLRKGFKKIEEKHPHNRRVPIYCIVICFVYAYVAEKFFGVADITGAYIAGLVLGGTLSETRYVEQKADTLGYMFFSPIFFATIGMNIEFSSISPTFILFGLCFVIAALVGKVGGCFVASKLCRYTNKESLQVGIGMMVRAEVILICTQKGIDAGVVSSAIFPFVFIIIIASSIIAPILLKVTFKEKGGANNTLEKPNVEIENIESNTSIESIQSVSSEDKI